MSRYISAVIDEIRGAMAAAIPSLVPGVGAASRGGVAPNGIWPAQQLNRVPFEKLTPPFAMIHLSTMTAAEEGEYGDTNLAYEFPVELYVVMEQPWDGLDLAGVLEDLRDYISQMEFTTANLRTVGDISWSEDLPANQILFEKNSACIAGRLIITLETSQGLNG